MDFLRQHDIVKPDKLNVPIHVIGCGGIGSPTAVALAKMGCTHLHLYDDDQVEPHNLPNQFYKESHLGRYKVDMLAAECMMYSTKMTVVNHINRLTGGDIAELDRGIIISAVDSMEGRHDLWEGVKYNLKVLQYIDGRMAAQQARVYTCNPILPDDVKRYEDTLVDPATVEPEPCTNRAIIYNTFMIAGIICNQVKRFCMKESLSSEIILDINSGVMMSM